MESLVVIKPEFLGNIESEFILSGTKTECEDYLENHPYKECYKIIPSKGKENFNLLKLQVQNLEKKYNAKGRDLLIKLIN